MIDARAILDRVGREHRDAVLEAIRMTRDACRYDTPEWGPVLDGALVDTIIAEMEVMS